MKLDFNLLQSSLPGLGWLLFYCPCSLDTSSVQITRFVSCRIHSVNLSRVVSVRDCPLLFTGRAVIVAELD